MGELGKIGEKICLLLISPILFPYLRQVRVRKIFIDWRTSCSSTHVKDKTSNESGRSKNQECRRLPKTWKDTSGRSEIARLQPDDCGTRKPDWTENLMKSLIWRKELRLLRNNWSRKLPDLKERQLQAALGNI